MKYASQSDSFNSRLLKKIAYACKLPLDAKVFGDSTVQTFSTFPFNPDSKSALQSATRWAVQGWRDIFKHGDAIPYEIVDNDPIKLRLIDLEVRDRGGRAYKVLDEQNRMFDLREDQLIDTIKLFGVGPGGHLNGTFVWGIQGSQIKLVVVGGTLYNAMIEGASKADALKNSAITRSSLKVNNVYQKRDGSNVFYVGKVIMPGETTPSYAFLSAPDVERTHGAEDEKKVYETKTWFEKFRYEQRFYSRMHLSLLVIKDPKFVEDLGESNFDWRDYVLNFKDKDCINFTNVRGYEHKLAEAFYEKNHGKRPNLRLGNLWGHDYVRESDKLASAKKDWAMQYNSQVVWVEERQ